MDVDNYATIWASLMLGAAFGAACCNVMPTRKGNTALAIMFLVFGIFARPFIMWAAA